MVRIYPKFQLLDLLGSSKIEQWANCEQQDNLRRDELWKVQACKHNTKRACFVFSMWSVMFTLHQFDKCCAI